MKNWEKYEKEIKANFMRFGINKYGEMVDCRDIRCFECEFGDDCTEHQIDWLYSDYEEPKPKPKLTKGEFIFLNSLEHPEGLIIRRNLEGDVYLGTYIISVGLRKEMFSFIAPGQEYTVSELKELEIEEGE